MDVPAPADNPLGRPSPMEIWHMTASDRADGGFETKAAITSMVGGLCVEWLGPNEYLLGTTGSHVLQATQNIYETGLSTGLVSFSLQTAVGATVAWTLSRYPDAIDKFQDRMRRVKNWEEESAESPSLAKRIGRQIIRPLLIGSAINLVMEAPKNEKKSFGENMRRVIGWSAIVGAGVSFIGTGGAELIVEGEKHGFESLAHIIVNDILPDPLSYLTIAGTIYGTTRAIKAVRNKFFSQGHRTTVPEL